MKIAAIVPMRHSSERVPGKNSRPFAGIPLYRHIIGSLSEVPQIHTIVIDTDSPTIMADAREHFPHVMLLERPEHLRAGDVPMNDVLLNTVKQIDADVYLQTHSTNPLLKPSTISRAIDLFAANHPLYDTLFSVTSVQSRLWDGLARAINHNPAILMRTQDLPPVYEENSNLYLFTLETLERLHRRIGERPLLFNMDRIESWDIDEEVDFIIAEQLYLCKMRGAAI